MKAFIHLCILGILWIMFAISIGLLIGSEPDSIRGVSGLALSGISISGFFYKLNSWWNK